MTLTPEPVPTEMVTPLLLLLPMMHVPVAPDKLTDLLLALARAPSEMVTQLRLLRTLMTTRVLSEMVM